MYLKCSLCEEELYLAKYYPSSGWYPQKAPLDLGDSLTEFLSKHSPCMKRNAEGEYDPDAPNVAHGKPDHMEHNIWGKVFTLRYE
jgi:hypothetical protein